MVQDVLLAIDTAHQTCSVALARREDDTDVYWLSEEVGNRHAERILSMIDEVLAEAKLSKADLGAIAFGRGPGSFTGLRVACGVAQGLGWGLNLPLVQVNNLEAFAQAVVREGAVPAGARLAIINDARMNEIYAQVFESAGEEERVRPVSESELIKPEAVCEWMTVHGATFVAGSALAAYNPSLSVSAMYLDVPESMIATMARLARWDWVEGNVVRAEEAAPLYIRDRVALTIDQRAHGEKL